MVQARDGLAVVVTTVGSLDEAERLAASALETRLAACVQIAEIRSHYRWEGKLCADPEWRLDCKTTRAKAEGLMTALAGAHPYDEPELIVLPVLAASEGYERWVEGETLTGSAG